MTVQGINEAALMEALAEEGISLGSLLVSERQKRGLSLQDISEKTRIRLEILKAIEREDWKDLPEPAYIKGFLLSYARALGLDSEKVLGLYIKVGQSTKPLKPLTKRTRSGKTFYLVILPLTIVLCVAIYVFGKDLLARSKGMVSDFFSWETRIERPSDSSVKEPGSPSPEKAKHPSEEVGPADSQVPKIAADEPPDNIRQQIEAIRSESEAPAIEEQPVQKAEEGDLTLKATALKRTWLRVVADGGEPMEYMLTAGMERDFYAKEGFELLIGNAGGIALEFNGEKMENLGSAGEVLRLKLPGDIKARGETR